MSALKVTMERFEVLDVGIIPRIVRMRATFGNKWSVFVRNRGESEWCCRKIDGHQGKKGYLR